MSLLDIRKKFIKRSGRFDLVEDVISYVNAGANDFINDGQKLLDLMQETTREDAVKRIVLTVADGSVIVDRVRSIKEVWIDDLGANEALGKNKLVKLDRDELFENWADPIADITTDRPTNWAPDILRDTSTEIDETRRRILIRPPVDFAYTLEVVGTFLSPKLGSTSDIFIDDNAVDNQTFEKGIGGWVEGTGGVLTSETGGRIGNAGKYIVGGSPSTTLFSLTTGLKKLVIGRQYTFIFYEKLEANWDGGEITITIGDLLDEDLQPLLDQIYQYTPTSSFVRHAFTFTAVRTNPDISFASENVPTAADILWLDEVDMTEPGVEETYWTEVYPELLVLAALHELEMSLRNSTGANDYMRQIERKLDGIDKQLVFEEANDINMMGG